MVMGEVFTYYVRMNPMIKGKGSGGHC